MAESQRDFELEFRKKQIQDEAKQYFERYKPPYPDAVREALIQEALNGLIVHDPEHLARRKR